MSPHLAYLLALWTALLPSVQPQLTLEHYEDLSKALIAAAGSGKGAGDTCDVHLGDTLLALMQKYGGKTPQEMKKVDDLAAAVGTDSDDTELTALRTNGPLLQNFTREIHLTASEFCPIKEKMICAGNLCHECQWLKPTDDKLTRRCEEMETLSKKFRDGVDGGKAGKVGGALDLIVISFGILLLLTF